MRPSIMDTARIALAIGATALVAAGCGGNDDETEAAAAAADAGGGLVSVASVDGTDVLADSQGRTLYTAVVEEGGEIKCVDACTSFWEPLTASPDEAEQAAADLGVELSVVDRPDGEQQLAFEGVPLYTFNEEDAGQLEGDGFVDDFQGTHFEWEAARTAGGSAPESDAEEPSSIPDYDY
jgi:predicted lipoprotein with Yx(FWY)xxD motif